LGIIILESFKNNIGILVRLFGGEQSNRGRKISLTNKSPEAIILSEHEIHEILLVQS